MAEQPIVCTLQGEAFPERVAWIQNLLDRHLIERQQDELVLRLTFAPEAAEEVAELVRRESACCAFLSFDQALRDGAVHLTITAPEEARESTSLIFWAFNGSTVPTRIQAPETRSQGFLGALLLGLSAMTGSCGCAKGEEVAQDHAAK